MHFAIRKSYSRTTGADGDHVDVIIGSHPHSELVYVVDQMKPGTHEFDEHKVVLGCTSEAEARQTYLDNFEPGWTGLGAITPMTIPAFKAWIKAGACVHPVAMKKAVNERHVSGDLWELEVDGKPIRGHWRTLAGRRVFMGKDGNTYHYSAGRFTRSTGADSKPFKQARKTPEDAPKTEIADHTKTKPEQLAEAKRLGIKGPSANTWNLTLHPGEDVDAKWQDKNGKWIDHRTDEYWDRTNKIKFENMYHFVQQLPGLQDMIERDLKLPDADKRRACAAAMYMVVTGTMRIGGEESKDSYDHYGAASIQKRHIQVVGNEVVVTFKGKHGKDWLRRFDDPKLVAAVKHFLTLPGDRLFQGRLKNGNLKDVTDAVVRGYTKPLGITPKEVRTFHASVEMYKELKGKPVPPTKRAQASFIKSCYEKVAEVLGNTGAMCKKSYVLPQLEESFLAGDLRAPSWATVEKAVRFGHMLDPQAREFCYYVRHVATRHAISAPASASVRKAMVLIRRSETPSFASRFMTKALGEFDHDEHVKLRRKDVEACKHDEEDIDIAGIAGFKFPGKYCAKCGRVKMDNARHHRLTSGIGPSISKAIGDSDCWTWNGVQFCGKAASFDPRGIKRVAILKAHDISGQKRWPEDSGDGPSGQELHGKFAPMYDHETHEKARALYGAGLSRRQVAKQMGIPEGSIAYILRVAAQRWVAEKDAKLEKAVSTECFRSPASCGLRWITAHPNGEEPGVPLLVHDNGEEYTVVGGAGGKMNQQVFKKPADQKGSNVAIRKMKAAEKRRQFAEQNPEEFGRLKENAKALQDEAKRQGQDIQDRAVAMVMGKMSGADAVASIEAEARKRALAENPNASPAEQEEFADRAVKAAKTEAKAVAKDVLNQVLDHAAMAELGDDTSDGMDFQTKLAGKTLVKRLSKDDIDSLMSAQVNRAEILAKARAIQRAIAGGDQAAMQGIEADIRPLSLDEAHKKNLDRYLNEQDVNNQTALVEATNASPELTRRRNQAVGAMDGINNFCASVTGKAILRPDITKTLGVEDAGRVAAAYLVHSGIDADTTAAGLRDRIGMHSAASVAAAIDKVRQMDAIVDNAKEASRSGDGSVTTAQSSILAANMASRKYRFLNVTRGQLRAANAIAHHLEHQSARPLLVNGGASETSAHAQAKSMGLGEGDYEVTKAERGTGGGYKVKVAPEDVWKIASPHGEAEADRNVTMDELKQDVEENSGNWHPEGLSDDIALQPHQELAARAIGKEGRMIMNYAAGCIDAATQITDPVRGVTMTAHEWMERGMAPNVWALSPDGPVVAQASVPFVKAYSPMFDVSFDNGETIRVTRAHKFLSPTGGWVPLAQLGIGHRVAVAIAASQPQTCVHESRETYWAAGPRLSRPGVHLTNAAQGCADAPSRFQPEYAVCRPQSIEGSGQSVCPSSAHGSQSRGTDYSDRYSHDRRLCDEQPLQASDNVQVFLPSLADAQAHNHCPERTDARVSTQGCNRPCRHCGHLSRRRLRLQAGRQRFGHQGFYSEGGTDIRYGRRLAASVDCLSRGRSILARPATGRFRSVSNQFWGGSACVNYTSGWGCITSITKADPALVYDLEVYKYHNYLAHGVWNHNSGKTAIYYAAAADALSSGKVDRVILSAPAKVASQQEDHDETDEKTGKVTHETGEADKFLTPEMRAQTMVMTSANAKKCIEAVKSGKCKILVVSQDMLRNKAAELKAAGFGGERSMTILDEAHRYAVGQTEGEGSGMAQVAKDFSNSDMFVAGSGSLIENDASELHSVLDMAHPGEYGSQKAFTGEWQRLAQGGGDIFASDAMRGMRDRLAGTMVTYHKPTTKANGEAVHNDRKVVETEVSDLQKAALAKVNVEYDKDKKSIDPAIRKSAALVRETKMKRILRSGVKRKDGTIDNPKMDALAKIMADEKAKDPKAKVGVFSSSLEPLRQAESTLKGRKGMRITGSEDEKATSAAIRNINDADSGLDWAGVSESGFTGLNMQGLDHIASMAPYDTPSKQKQAESRHARRGATKDKRSTVFVAKHPMEMNREFVTEHVKKAEMDLLSSIADEHGYGATLVKHLPAIESQAGESL